MERPADSRKPLKARAVLAGEMGPGIVSITRSVTKDITNDDDEDDDEDND